MIAKISLAVVAVSAMGLTVAWATGFLENPQMKALDRLQAEIQQTLDKPPADTVEAEANRSAIRREKVAEYREKVQSLPEQQQEVAKSQMRKFFVSQFEKRIDRVLSLPPEERNAELDQQIDEWDERRKRWQQEREQKAEKSDSQNKGGRAHSRSSWRNSTPEQRSQWRRQLLANTTPQQRAKWQEYRRLMNQRRKERGLPESRRPF
jgi:hypothetical protein